MITALEIENFKAIGPRQRIELAPITLLFGPNSAGKSTILHALLYLHTVLKTGDPDVDQVELGGETVRLGGFQRLIHGRDTSRSMRLRVEFGGLGSMNRFKRNFKGTEFDAKLGAVDALEDEFEGAWIEIEVATEIVLGGEQCPRVVRAWFGVRDEVEPLAQLARIGPEEGDVGVAVNTGHPLCWARDVGDHTDLGFAVLEFVRDFQGAGAARECWMISSTGFLADSEIVEEESLSREQRYFKNGWGDRWLPSATSPGVVFTMPSSSRNSVIPSLSRPISIRQYSYEDSGEAVQLAEGLLEVILIGITSALAEHLDDAVHLGPLRAVPNAGFLYRRPGRRSEWSKGLAAWGGLLDDVDLRVERARAAFPGQQHPLIPGHGFPLFDLVNNWLERLSTGSRIEIETLFDAAGEEAVRRLVIRTPDGNDRRPVEVGSGVSQLVPVLVALLRVDHLLTLVEQPELHVHPALQVGLGDLLIAASKGARGERGGLSSIAIVETHSEHLLLRLLRRVQETTEGKLEDDALTLDPEQLSVLYIEPSEQGSTVRRLRVDEDGDFLDQWPRGFFDERTQELLG